MRKLLTPMALMFCLMVTLVGCEQKSQLEKDADNAAKKLDSALK